MRLNQYLAKAGIASRRKCDQLIKNQQIMINGEVVTNFGYRVKNDDIVTFDGKVVSESLDIIYILNKPKGYVCSNTNLFKRKYYVVSKLDINKDDCSRLKQGLRLEDGTYVKADLKKINKEKNNIYWDILLNEGKNREIKKIFLHFGSKVIDLHRYKFANIDVKSLKVGKYRKISVKKLKFLSKLGS